MFIRTRKLTLDKLHQLAAYFTSNQVRKDTNEALYDSEYGLSNTRPGETKAKTPWLQFGLPRENTGSWVHLDRLTC